MRVLVACEESQAVTKELRRLGHEAYSCDIEPCSGGHPEWHLQQDVTQLLKIKWDMIIAFPPCTDLAVSGARYFEQKRKDGRQKKSIEFFMMFADCGCPKIAIENPVSSRIFGMPPHTQEIQLYQFGHPVQKKTRLWLRGLPELKPTNEVDYKCNCHEAGTWFMKGGKDRQKNRAKTFPGVAKAMAEQWAGKNMQA